MKDLRTARPRMRLTCAFAVLTAAWFATSYALPAHVSGQIGRNLSSILYDGWSLLVAALALAWVVRYRWARAWLPLVLALAAMTMGDTVWDLSAHGVIPVPNDTPSLMDLLYLPAYAAWGVNVVLLVRRYHPRGAGPLIETLVVAGGAAAAAFPLLIGPDAETIGSGSLFSRRMNPLDTSSSQTRVTTARSCIRALIAARALPLKVASKASTGCSRACGSRSIWIPSPPPFSHT